MTGIALFFNLLFLEVHMCLHTRFRSKDDLAYTLRDKLGPSELGRSGGVIQRFLNREVPGSYLAPDILGLKNVKFV